MLSAFSLLAQSEDGAFTQSQLNKIQRWKQESRSLLGIDTSLAFKRARAYIDSTNEGNQILRGEAFGNLGVLHLMTDRASKAVRPLRKSMLLFRASGDSVRTGYAYRNLGMAQNRLERPDSALDNYYLSLSYIDSLRSTYFYALSAFEMARTLFSLQTHEYSARYYNLAIRLFVLDGRLSEAASALYELSYLLVRQGDDSYQAFAERALRLAVQEGDSALVGRVESIRARHWLNKEMPDKAWPHLQRTQRIYRDIYDAFFLLAVDQLIADYYLQKDELELAEFRASESLKALDARPTHEFDENYLREQLYKTLFTTYYRMKNYPQAIAFAQAYKQTAEQLIQRSETNKLRFMEREIQSIQRQQELERTKLELQFAEENQALLRRQIIGFGLAALLLLALLGTLVIGYRRIQKSKAELEEQKAFIEKQHQELEALNADKDQLFAIVGHDLRGPVGNLSNLLTFIPAEGDVISEESQEILDIAQQGLIESLDLLENLLIWAKEQKEDFSIKREQQELMPYLKQIQQLYAPLIKQKGIQFEYKMEEKASAYFDRNTFKTVVRNIVSNGIKYIPDGSVIRYTGEEKGNQFRLVIEDNGKGIPEDVMNALSSDQEGGHRVLKKKDKGDLGLGLRMSRDFVRANGGDMKIIANGPLGGACFDITLPLTV